MESTIGAKFYGESKFCDFIYIYPKKIFEKVFSKSVNGIIIGLTESFNGGYIMNERFFSLPVEKQQAIYRVYLRKE